MKIRWEQNALIESFCVHARNLNEFFLESSPFKHTLKASDFTDDAYRRPTRTVRRRALFKKIDRQIAHLTAKRASVARLKIGSRHRDQMFSMLVQDLKNFDRHLRHNLRKKWKVKFE